METAQEVKLKSNEKSIKCEKSINLSLKVYFVPSSALFVVDRAIKLRRQSRFA